MLLEKIKIILHDNIGLHPDSIGDSSIKRAVNHRMNTLNISEFDVYFSKLSECQDELDELVEEVVVPETWFFRNIAPFETLVKCIPDIQKSKGSDVSPLKILSVPCSTGEEPYSIAITLLKSGVENGGFKIDAVDISKRALTKARRAIYGKHSFRESDGIVDERYFQQTRSGQQLLPAVRDHVNFIKGNILKDIITSSPEYYDIIFCRNLLIYFNRETQQQALKKIYALLKPGGILFVGHAETSEAEKLQFTKLDVPKSFAYKKAKDKKSIETSELNEQAADKLRLIYDQLVEVTLKDIELSKKIKKSPIRSPGAGQGVANQNISMGWWKVEKLIEEGHLSDASSLCGEKLKIYPEEAQGYYYLGLICSLEGSVAAADSLLKKAVYLDPNNHKALGLSALIAEQRGDIDIAESLRRREGRAKERSK